MRPDGVSRESKSSVSPPAAAGQSKGNSGSITSGLHSWRVELRWRSRKFPAQRLGSYLSARPGHCRLIYLFAGHNVSCITACLLASR